MTVPRLARAFIDSHASLPADRAALELSIAMWLKARGDNDTDGLVTGVRRFVERLTQAPRARGEVEPEGGRS